MHHAPLVAIALGLTIATPAAAQVRLTPADRELEFQAGLLLAEPLAARFAASPSMEMDFRYHAQKPAYVSLHVALGLLADQIEVVDIEIVPTLGVGLGSGLCADLGSHLSVCGGARVEWLNAWSWPRAGARRRDVHDGLRLGPTADATLWLGRAWGHPIAVMIQLAYPTTRLDGRWYSGFQGGIGFSGALLPEPTAPPRRSASGARPSS